MSAHTLPLPTASQAPATRQLPSLLSRILRCASAALLNYGGGQVIRLGGNLILTRILVPEAFGLMALINVFVIGLNMFSDVGLGPSIIRKKVNPSLQFLQTAWTLQIIRGLVLTLLLVGLAYPISQFYGEPQLLFLIPVLAIRETIMGFRSVQFFVEEREMRHMGPTLLNLSTALIGLIAAVLLAWSLNSVWALVWSGLISAILNVLASHLFLPACPHRIHWDSEAAKELLKFGKWILASTALAFIATQGDRLVLGKMLTMEELGIYTVAFFFAQASTSLLSGISNRVLLPMLSQKECNNFEKRRRTYGNYRLGFAALGLPLLGIFAGWGSPIIAHLYDARYASAGPMLEILSLGAAAAVLRSFCQPLILSAGDGSRRTLLSAVEGILLMALITAGHNLAGMNGLLWGWVVAQWGSLFVAHCLVRKYSIHRIYPDLIFLSAITIIFLL